LRATYALRRHAGFAGFERCRLSSPEPGLATNWLGPERRLAGVYARSYVRIYDVIAAADTPSERARMPRALRRLLHAPDALRTRTADLEQQLHVPDCTGGG
jgi:hypothetical protein